MTLSRRHVLTAALAVPLSTTLVACTTDRKSSDTLTGKVHSLGFLGQRHPDGLTMWRQGVFESPSLLTSLDLATGEAHQTALPMARGHSVVALSDGRLVCIPQNGDTVLVVDADHAHSISIAAGDGFAFGGHGWEDLENSLLLLPVMVSPARSVKDSGLLRLHDLQTLEMVMQKPSGGIHPHEIVYLKDEDKLAITHYGNIRQIGREGPFAFSPADPKLSLYKRQTLKNLKNYRKPDLNGVLTHLTADQQGNIYTVSNQYLTFDPDVQTSMFAAMDNYKQLTGFHVPALTQPLVEERRFALPHPIRKTNLKSGITQLLEADNTHLLRSQSITHHMASGRIFVTFAYSDNILILEGGKPALTIDAHRFGLGNIRGAADLQGTPYLILTDRHNGIAVVHAQTLELHTRFDVPLYGSAHVSAATA